MEQVEHSHIATHSSLVTLIQSMSQFPVCPSITPISLSVHWGFNYRTTEEPHYTERKRVGTARDRNERDRGNRQRGETGINRETSDPFATEILNIIIPDTTSCSQN